jgi:hypothetical protein
LRCTWKTCTCSSVLEKYISGAQSRASEGVYQSAEDVAKVLVDIASQKEPPIRSQTSAWSREFVSLKTQADPTGKAQQQKIAAQLL